MQKIEYREFPKTLELINPIGIGLGGMQVLNEAEIQQLINKAVDNNINFFDLCGGGSNVYRPFGQAIKNRREKVFIEVHLGAVYNNKQEYGWSRDLEKIKKTFEWELKELGTNYVDFGFLHCIDTLDDIEEVINNGILDYAKELHEKGIIRHLGFSSHTPEICNKLLDMKIFDLFLFSLNPAYDYEVGDEYGVGTTLERNELLKRCVKEEVAISVMKPFFGGQLLSKEHSPFKESLTVTQCLQYAIDRPGVIAVCPGVTSMKELDDILKYFEAEDKDKDYSVIKTLATSKINGVCVYCKHCQPCPVGIDIGLINKYYDLALAGDKIAKNHYSKLEKNASDCIKCGHCNSRCPFNVKQMEKMEEIDNYFSGGKNDK